MREEAFEMWMRARYRESSAKHRILRARRVENAFGDLDQLYDEDRLADVLAELTYSRQDALKGRSNPTHIPISGDLHKQLGKLKNAAFLYREFRASGGEEQTVTDTAIELAGEALKQRREGRQFELERHLQSSLRTEITQLERGLTIIDDGTERAVNSGSIDILAQGADGALVVIELKAGEARREALGQILGYMGDLKAEEPNSLVRGILVAASFDKSCRAAVAIVPAVQLREYRFSFSFAAPDRTEDAPACRE